MRVCMCATFSWLHARLYEDWLSYFLWVNSIRSQHLTSCLCRCVGLRSQETLFYRTLPAQSTALEIWFSFVFSLIKCLPSYINLQNFLWLQTNKGFHFSTLVGHFYKYILSRKCFCWLAFLYNSVAVTLLGPHSFLPKRVNSISHWMYLDLLDESLVSQTMQ